MRQWWCGAGIYAFLAIIMTTAPVRAQSTGAIQGTVTDAQGAVVPGATVTVRHVATGVERSLVTDAAGEYQAPSLAPGRYRDRGTSVRLPGSGARGRCRGGADGRRQHADDARRAGRGVSVMGSTPVIETATTSVGQVISQRTVQEIPLNGRHFVDLGLLIPGSVTPPQNGFLSAPAARPGLVRVQHGGQPRRHRQLHDQRRQPERPGAEPDHVPAVDQHGVGVQGRQLDVQRRIRPQLRRHRQHRDAVGRQRLARRGCSSSSATTRSIRGTAFNQPPVPAVAVQAQSVRRRTSADRSSRTGRSSSAPTRDSGSARGSTSTAACCATTSARP